MADALFIEGWDPYTNDLFTANTTGWEASGSPTFSLDGPGRYTTGQYLSVSSPTINDFLFNFQSLGETPQAELLIGLNVYIDNDTNGVTLFQMYDGSFAVIFTLSILSDGTLQYQTGDSAETYTSSTSNVVPVKTDKYIELHIVFADSATGTLTMRVEASDGSMATVFTGTNIITAQSGVSGGGELPAIVAVGNGPVRYDDIYIAAPGGNTTTFLGRVYGFVQVASGEGRVNQWTPFPNTNSNWQCVNQSPATSPGLAYVTAIDTRNAIDAYTQPGTPENVDSIYIVRPFALAQLDAANDGGDFISAGIGNGSAETFDSGSEFFGTGYFYVQNTCYDGDPNNSNAAWTSTSLNSAQPTIKVIS